MIDDNTFVNGSFLANCDRCGFSYRNSQIRLQWNNLRCCFGADTNNCWEDRNQQETAPMKTETSVPSWVRPDSEGTDVSVGSGNEVHPGDL